MSQPVPPTADEPVVAAEPEPGTEPAEPAPLNRAARRAKADKAEPTHVGPRADIARQARGARPHTKRRRG
ncbi:MAG TPA: hypothetical protein VD903_04550 [Pseudonocardia sp.]|nr:hypothetical protein [Pseudonocardia sp.]